MIPTISLAVQSDPFIIEYIRFREQFSLSAICVTLMPASSISFLNACPSVILFLLPFYFREFHSHNRIIRVGLLTVKHIFVDLEKNFLYNGNTNNGGVCAMLDLYRNIRLLRKSLKMSQEELANKVGYGDRSSIAKIEAGKVDLPQSQIFKIAAALNVTPSDLMGLDGVRDDPAASLDDDEAILLNTYRELSREGKDKLLERCAELKELGYKKGSQDFRSDAV